jgi:tetratricopeptide (TPR) repeat protein
MYFERGNYTAAVENFKKLVEKEPRNIEWLYGYAESLAKAGKYQEAIAALNKTQDQTGPHPELTMQKYRLYMEAGKNAEGEQELLKGLELFPSEPSIIATLVDHYFRTRQEAKAIVMLERLVAADPNNGRANLALGDIYLRQGKIDQAITAIIRALPAEDADLDSKMKLLIALYDQVTVVSDELLNGLDVLIATYPNKAKPHSIKGDFLLKADKEVEALKAYREALEYDKNQYPIWNQVLIMSYQLGEYEALYAESKSCMEYFPSVATVYLLNGVAANQLRKYD